MSREHRSRVGIVWRSEPGAPVPAWDEHRLGAIARRFDQHGLEAVPVPFCEEEADTVRETMRALDAVLVWVDPVVRGRDRSVLDALLREAARGGVYVSTHPDVIEKMGTKEVLVRTSGMECGTPALLYRDLDEMRALLPDSLSSGPRVIKRDRGSGGNAVWKVELAEGAMPSLDAPVAVLHAGRGSQVERVTLREFLERSATLFEAGSTVVDQPFQARIAEGMTRAYMVHDKVAGFGHQFVTALSTAADSDVTPPPPPRYYFGPGQPEFQRLKAKLESAWIAEIQQLCGVPTAELPAVWDADFLLGPPDAAARDTYVLCEVNVMGVFPIPEATLEPLATAVAKTLAGRHPRG